MRETRELPINDIIINIADLTLLARQLFKEIEDQPNDGNARFEVRIIREDGVQF